MSVSFVINQCWKNYSGILFNYVKSTNTTSKDTPLQDLHQYFYKQK